MKSKVLGFFAAMMQLVAPWPEGNKKLIYWHEKKAKPEWVQKELILAAQRKRFKRIDRNINNEKRGAYTNAIR